MKAGNGCVSISHLILRKRRNKVPGKSAFHPRSVVINNAGTMTRKLSGQNALCSAQGNSGGILLRAYLKQGLFSPKRVSATVLHGDKAATLSKDLGVGVTSDNCKGVAGPTLCRFASSRK